jgi:hypothetical protein
MIHGCGIDDNQYFTSKGMTHGAEALAQVV